MLSAIYFECNHFAETGVCNDALCCALFELILIFCYDNVKLWHPQSECVQSVELIWEFENFLLDSS